jgi:hypothetical protein
VVKLSSSKSSSDSSQTTTNYDMRVVGGNGSTNVSNSGGTVQVLDAGAVNGAFGFSRAVYEGAVSSLDKSMSYVAGAYSEAKAGEQKVLVGGGLIILGIVAVSALKGRQ